MCIKNVIRFYSHYQKICIATGNANTIWDGRVWHLKDKKLLNKKVNFIFPSEVLSKKGDVVLVLCLANSLCNLKKGG